MKRTALLARKMTEMIEAELLAAICGPVRKQPQTALRLRGNTIETVELDDAGKVIEPPRRCPSARTGLY